MYKRQDLERSAERSAADASARRPLTTGLERAAKRPHTETRVAHGDLAADQPLDQPSSPTSLTRLSVAQLRAFLNKRGVGGAAVAIAGKPQLLAQARVLLAKNDTE